MKKIVFLVNLFLLGSYIDSHCMEYSYTYDQAFLGLNTTAMKITRGLGGNTQKNVVEGLLYEYERQQQELIKKFSRELHPYAFCDLVTQRTFQDAIDFALGQNVISVSPWFSRMRAFEFQAREGVPYRLTEG